MPLSRRAVAVAATLAVLVGVGPALAEPDAGAPAPAGLVTITSPTATAPTVVAERTTYRVTFRADGPGTYAVEQRQQGKTAFVNAASGDPPGGDATVDVEAPKKPGTYDLRVRFLTPDGERGADTESAAVTVTDPTGQRAAHVAITRPTAAQPEITMGGAPFVLAFTTDLPGRYTVTYASDAPFPGGTGIMATAGTRTLTLTAPTTPDSYDLGITFTTVSGITSHSAQPAALVVTIPGITDSQRCDPIDPAHCLLPFPNDFFTAPDPTTDTGRRVNLNILSMPRNVAGKPVDPTEWNRNDGFSPGSMLLARVPALDLHRTWGMDADQVTDLARYADADAPIVVIDAATGERHPLWTELDTHPKTTDDKRLLIVRPAVNFEEGHRYVVALRDLRRTDGSVIAPNAVFANYRDRGPAATDPWIEARRPAMEDLFTLLGRAGIARNDLYLAWDFTVASERNLTERVLHIRDDAFAQLGDTNLADGAATGNAPTVTIDSTEDFATGATLRRVNGTIQVPNYLTPQVVTPEVSIPDPVGESGRLAAPGSRFDYLGSTDGLPVQNPLQPTLDVPFVCDIPRTALTTPAHPMLYGHGLLGSKNEATGSSTEDLRLRGFAPCAVDWIGMAFEDVPNVAVILTDITQFASLADRAQQGFLNFLYLGRALFHAKGLATNAAFELDGHPLINSGELFYDGNSQGGIMGGALTALAPDFRTSVLGVPGMNYSTLLNRSVDWEGEYGEIMYTTYPDKLEQQINFALIQMLWDRGEANGYAQHITTDPLPNTPSHQVLMQVAFSDHQVSNFAAEVEGRTIGARLRVPTLAPGQHWSVDPTFGFTTTSSSLDSTPGASYLVYWYSADRANTTPPTGNVPSSSGGDPHGDPRKDNAGSDQEARFLLDGVLVDVCNGQPCVTTDATRKN
jgi:hypothetical protein